MNWEIYYKTEQDQHKLYTLNDLNTEQIKEHLKNKFKDEIEHNLKVELIEYPDEGGIPYSVEYCLSDSQDYYIFGFHAFQLED